VLVCCLSLANATELPKPNSPSLQPLDSIVARVNGDIITQDELNTAFNIAWQQQKAAEAQGMPAVSEAKVRQMLLDQLIAQKIQIQMAKQQGLKIGNEQLDQAIENIAKEHGVSTSQLYEEVAKTGMSQTQYREQIRDQITIMTLQRGVVGSQAMPTPAEIKAYQEEHSAYIYRVGDILLPLASDPSKDAVEKAATEAQAIKNSLNQSKNFEQVATEVAPNNYSILDWRPLTDLPDIFAHSIQSASVNQAAGPVRAPNGLHVLFLLGKKKNLKALSEQQVQMLLFQEKSEKIISPWLKKLRETSDIQIFGDS
jgi:peptidyl-prolyl cis-trans isomerase SurA